MNNVVDDIKWADYCPYWFKQFCILKAINVLGLIWAAIL